MVKELIITILVFLGIDFAWIMLVVNKQYNSQLGEGLLAKQPNLAPAVLFYLIFCFALWYLVINTHSGDLKETLIRAAVFGVASYATYTLTNLSILNGWDVRVAIADILWGGTLAVLVTYITLLFK